MHQIIIEYEGALRTRATHLQSGNEIITDAPVDNHGKGEAFSPTDLVVASLGSCMLTIMGITAKSHGFNIDGSSVDLEKTMGKFLRLQKSKKCMFGKCIFSVFALIARLSKCDFWNLWKISDRHRKKLF